MSPAPLSARLRAAVVKITSTRNMTASGRGRSPCSLWRGTLKSCTRVAATVSEPIHSERPPRQGFLWLLDSNSSLRSSGLLILKPCCEHAWDYEQLPPHTTSYGAAMVRFPCSRPEVTDVSPRHRKEVRVPLKTFVNLSSSDDPSFEIAHTIDISCHGARVVTRRSWQPNQQLAIRSIRGSLKSPGRVAHCQPFTENRFVIGIEIYSLGDWTARDITKTT